jgi:hypothetical protein
MIDSIEYCSFPGAFPIIKGSYNELLNADYEVQKMIDIVSLKIKDFCIFS